MSRILVVDDHPAIRAGVERILAKSFTDAFIEGAAGGREALAKVRASKWSLVVLDLVLPDLSGFEVLSELKDLEPGMPVLVFSTYTDEAHVIRALKDGRRRLRHQRLPHRRADQGRHQGEGRGPLPDACARRAVGHPVPGSPRAPPPRDALDAGVRRHAAPRPRSVPAGDRAASLRIRVHGEHLPCPGPSRSWFWKTTRRSPATCSTKISTRRATPRTFPWDPQATPARERWVERGHWERGSEIIDAAKMHHAGS